jgi:hypothetical protein
LHTLPFHTARIVQVRKNRVLAHPVTLIVRSDGRIPGKEFRGFGDGRYELIVEPNKSKDEPLDEVQSEM